MTTRREFLETTAAILAASAWPAVAGSGARFPIGFSTLGCPKWDWLQILDFASGHGYASIELRGILDTMDLPRCPEFAPDRLTATKAQLAQHELVISDLGSSANMHELDATKHAAALDEGRRFIDLAQSLGAPYVRVFGNQYVPGVARDDMLAHIARGLRELGDYAQGRNVTVLIESHGDFTDSPSLQALLERAASPNVALLWDAHHTFVSGKEEPEETVRRLGSYIRHTHLKDSVPAGNDRRYVLTGTGDVPVRRQVEALMKIGYKGFYSFEWEKRWHPEIEEPEVAFAQFVTVVTEYLRRG